MPISDEISGLLRELSANAALPFEQALGLPAAAYSSPAFAALEAVGLFRREWICIGRADDLPKTGDYVATDIAGVPIVTLRDKANQIRSFSNVCLHRMMRLAEGRGNCGGRLTCPYHAWTYNLQGRLIGASHMEDTPGFRIGEQGLPEIRTELWQGWVYATLDKDASPLAPRLEPLTRAIEAYGMADYGRALQQDEVWQTNWKCLAENYMEDYHAPFVHRNSIGVYLNDEFADGFEAGDAYHFHNFLRGETSPRGLAHPANRRLEGRQRRISVMVCVYPAHVITLAPDHLWYLSLLPEATDRVRVRFGVSFAPEVLAEVNDWDGFVAGQKATFDRINAEDRGALEALRRSLDSPMARPGRLSFLERFTYDLNRYLCRRLAA